jgi:hypothetical protein
MTAFSTFFVCNWEVGLRYVWMAIFGFRFMYIWVFRLTMEPAWVSGGLSWLAEGQLLFDSEGGQKWRSMVMRCNGTEARNVL